MKTLRYCTTQVLHEQIPLHSETIRSDNQRCVKLYTNVARTGLNLMKNVTSKEKL